MLRQCHQTVTARMAAQIHKVGTVGRSGCDRVAATIDCGKINGYTELRQRRCWRAIFLDVLLLPHMQQLQMCRGEAALPLQYMFPVPWQRECQQERKDNKYDK